MASKVFFAKNGEQLSEVEQQVNTIVNDLTAKDMPKELAGLPSLNFVSVKEVEVAGGKKAFVVFVPFRQLKKFQKIQERLVADLEKKLGGNVVIIAQRTILSEAHCQKTGIRRPRSRTMTAVHNAILEDIVYPTQIVGKRTRVRLDQSKLLKVFLSSKEQAKVEDKLKTFSTVFAKLTNKAVEFSFPSQQ